MPVDHYRTLGVRPDADRAAIRAAYLQSMRACHPDLRPRDPFAAQRASTVNAAWETLGDEVRRAAYDRARRTRGLLAATDGRRSPALRLAPARDPERARYRRHVDRAVLRVAVATFAAGLLSLVAFA